MIADHYNEGARRDAHAEPLTNRQGWERSQSAHFWKALYATACGVPQLIDFALRTCADAVHRPLSIHPYICLHACLPACLSIRLSTSLSLCRYGNDARMFAYGQSMGGDCFLTGARAYVGRTRIRTCSVVG